MKFLIAFILITFLNNCSFDNKTGIWNNENSVKKAKDGTFDGFKTLTTKTNSFDKVIKIKPELKFSINKPVTINKWSDIFFSQSNNSNNFSYNHQNILSLKSKKITAPMPGTYYESPTPEDPPFVKKGENVKKGQVLCIIEAMKIMNEIECDEDGKIIDVLVQNSDPVEYNQPLYVIEPL